MRWRYSSGRPVSSSMMALANGVHSPAPSTCCTWLACWDNLALVRYLCVRRSKNVGSSSGPSASSHSSCVMMCGAGALSRGAGPGVVACTDRTGGAVSCCGSSRAALGGATLGAGLGTTLGACLGVDAAGRDGAAFGAGLGTTLRACLGTTLGAASVSLGEAACLKIAANLSIAPSCPWPTLKGVAGPGDLMALMRSCAALAACSAGVSPGMVVFCGKNSTTSASLSALVLGMYVLKHL